MTLCKLHARDLRGVKLGVSWTYSASTKKPIAPHHDFLYAASFFGPDIVFGHPPEMRIDPQVKATIKGTVEANGGSYAVVYRVDNACDVADVIYAKKHVCLYLLPPVVAEPKHDEMAKLFSRYRDRIADVRSMRLGKPNVHHMHCLPCERGFEVTDEVLDRPWARRGQEPPTRAQGVMACNIPYGG